MMAEMGVALGHLINLQKHWGGHSEEFIVEMLDNIFRGNRSAPKRRYSDGFAALYTAEEIQTAIAEVRHWVAKWIARQSENGNRVAYYLAVSMSFSGKVKDTRPLVNIFPDLTHKRDYTLCNRVGRRLWIEGLDGLLAASARRRGGTCVPVFRRQAVIAGSVLEEIEFLQGRGRARFDFAAEFWPIKYEGRS